MSPIDVFFAFPNALAQTRQRFLLPSHVPTLHVTHQVTIGRTVRALNVHAKMRHAQVARRYKSRTRETGKAGIWLFSPLEKLLTGPKKRSSHEAQRRSGITAVRALTFDSHWRIVCRRIPRSDFSGGMAKKIGLKWQSLARVIERQRFW